MKGNMNSTDYNKQATDFLYRNGIKFRATLSDSKVPPWDDGKSHGIINNQLRVGHHYRVTLSRAGFYKHPPKSGWCKDPRRLTFDFWGSIADAENGIKGVSAYDVLACISGDVNAPDTFKDYCSEFGESTDSIKAKQTFTRLNRFAKRLRAFFTESELEQLAEIH